MTDRTANAPERIWALAYDCEDEPDAIAIGYAEPFFGAHEYIRADLAPDPLADARVKALIGALGDIADGEPEWPDEPQKELDWCRQRALTALAAFYKGDRHD